MTLGQLADRLGVPFDRIKWWVRQGYLRATPERPGRGHYKEVPLHEAYLAQEAVRLQRKYGIEASRDLFQRLRHHERPSDPG